MEFLSDSDKSEHGDISDDIKQYLEIYIKSNGKSKMVILFLIDPAKYSKKEKGAV